MTSAPPPAVLPFPGRCVFVVPCYNEAARLDRDAFRRFVASRGDVDLLFVDDGSTDDTRAVLRELAAGNAARVAVLGLNRNGGKGEAVRRGMLAAVDDGAAVVGYWDADLATPLDEVDAFLAELRSRPDADAVIGARVRLLGRTIERRLVRHLGGRCFATAASMVLRLPVYDTQCGAKLFRAGPTLEAALGRPFVSRWVFDVELLGRLAALNEGHPHGGIVELPLTTWADVAGSKVGPRDAAGAIVELARTARTLKRFRRSHARTTPFDRHGRRAA